MRRALHGRDLEDPQSRQDRADPGPQSGLLARLLDHRRGRTAAAREIPGRAGGRLCQHLGRGEGGGRHLLHLLERARGGREPGRRHGHLPARPISCEIGGRAHQGEDHTLAWRTSASPADELRGYREGDPSLKIIAHPECPPDVLAEADYTGSTAGMIEWVRKRRPRRVVMVTECSMADNVQAELPDVEFVRPCNLCPHMKRITLPKILESLVYLKEEIVVDPAIAARARRSVERMVSLKR